MAQAPVVPPEVLPSGVHGVITADIDPAKSAPVRVELTSRRRPELYQLLSLHRSPTDIDASSSIHHFTVSIQGQNPALLVPSNWRSSPKVGLTVLPALFRLGPDRFEADYQRLAEPKGGASETVLMDLARRGDGYAVGSYPVRDGGAVYHTIALAAAEGIVARYRATHLRSGDAWATRGDKFVVAPTRIGRVALALGEELSDPEVFGVYSAERADIIAAPSRRWDGPLLEIDPRLFNVPYPEGTPYAPYAAALLGHSGSPQPAGLSMIIQPRCTWPRAGHRNSCPDREAWRDAEQRARCPVGRNLD